MKNSGVTEGALVYVLGFPVSLDSGLVDTISKAPVCRLGCVSRIEHLYHNNSAKFFIIDATTYPGNSGGPVINRPEFISMRITSALIKLPGGRSGYYACSEKGLLLVVTTQQFLSGQKIRVLNPQKKLPIDSKSGAYILEL